MKSLFTLIAIGVFSILTGCAKTARPLPASNCEQTVIIDQGLYQATAINYGIASAVINNDCLEIKFGASGCSGSSWVVDLVDANIALDSNPMQRLLRLKLINKEVCMAEPSKTVTFDLTPLRIQSAHSLRLILDGYSGILIYNY